MEHNGQGSFRALTYHRVGDEKWEFFAPTPTRVFSRQILFLSRLYRVYTAGELALSLRKGLFPKRAVCITFDDGYKDIFSTAFPLLNKLGLRATLFLSTGPLETGEPLWHDKMFCSFALTKKRVWNFRGKEFDLRSPAQRVEAVAISERWLKSLDERERKEAVDDLLADLNVSKNAVLKNLPKVTWGEVRSMADVGIEIGAHTISHPILSRLSRARQEEEIVGSIEVIEKRIGIRPKVFSYPNGKEGDFDDNTIAILRKAGILAAYTTMPGVNRLGADPYGLRRGGAWSGNILKFAFQMLRCRWLS